MNPDMPSNEREELEAQLTALLLGELTPEQAAAVEARIAGEPELLALQAKLRQSVEMLRSASQPLLETKPATEAPRLSPHRRQALLKEFRKSPPRTAYAFDFSRWVVPVAAAAVITVLAAAMLLPSLGKAKAKAMRLTQLGATATLSAPEPPAARRFAATAAQESAVSSRPASEGPASTFSDDTAALGRLSNVRRDNNDGAVTLAGAEFIRQTTERLAPSASTASVADKSALVEERFGSQEVRLRELAGLQIRPASKPQSTVDSSAGSFGIAATVPSAPAAQPASPLPAPSPGQQIARVEEARQLTRGRQAGVGIIEAPGTAGGLGGGGESRPPGTAASGQQPAEGADVMIAGKAARPARGANVPQDEEARQSFGYFSRRVQSAPGSAPVLGDLPVAGRLFAEGTTEQEEKVRALDARASMFFDSYALAEHESLAKKVDSLSYDVKTKSLEKSVKREATVNGEMLARGEIAAELGEQIVAGARIEEVQSKYAPALASTELTNSLATLLQNAPLPPQPRPPLAHQPETATKETPLSTFSLNVSDVSFKLANASLEAGALPDASSVRAEEFINAFDYRDPEPAPGSPVGFAWERARHPFAHNRDLLRLSVKTAAVGRPEGQALNLTLLLDNSGSMERADRVRIIREALRVLGNQLQPVDKLSVVTFARNASLKADGVPGNEAGKVLENVAGLTPEGGTNLEEAMNAAYDAAVRNYLPAGQNRVVLLTDGAANLGDVSAENLKKKVEEHRKQGIALDCFGIGWEGYNDDLLENLSRNGDGRYGFVNTPEAASKDFAAQLAGALQVAASDVKVQVAFNPSRVVAYRQVGYAKHQLTAEQFRDNTVDAGEIAAAEAGNALYVIQVAPEGTGGLGTVRVRYKVPGTAFYHEHEWVMPYLGSAPPLEKASPALRLNATAGMFADWLARNPYAADVSPGALLPLLHGIPEQYGADTRPATLQNMLRQARQIAGN